MSAGTSEFSAQTGNSGYRDIRIFLWAFVLGWVAFLAFRSLTNRDHLLHVLPEMAVWVVVGAIVNLLPLQGWQSAPFAADDPMVLAVAILFTPVEAAMITFLAAFDPGELRGTTKPSKALWNRSQLSVAWFFASATIHSVIPNPATSKLLIPLAFLGMSAAYVLNYSLVALSITLERGYTFSRVVRHMTIGAPVDFFLAFLAWGVLAAMLVSLYGQLGAWAVPAFLGPTLLGRQVLGRSQESIDTSRAYRSREAAMTQLSRQIDQERAEERRLVAGELHDDVLQLLFKVTLLGQVLKTELADETNDSIRDDLHDLTETAEVAAALVRDLIGDLRRPGLGRGGLSSAVERLSQMLQERSTAKIHRSLVPIDFEDSGRQLAAYQVLKEAITNAVHHSGARNVWIEIVRDKNAIVMRVRDDGIGFDPHVEKANHYGLHIMRERVASIGGSLYIDSSPGRGTCVTAAIPPS